MRVARATTVDNKFDPFDEWDDWYAFDRDHGYLTCERVAKLTHTSKDLSPLDNAQAIEDGIDRLIRINPIGIHKKVVKEI
mgnify:CR=1 FL=1